MGMLMNKIWLNTALTVFVASLATGLVAQDAKPGEIIVRANPNAKTAMRGMSQQLGAQVLREARNGEVVTLKLPTGTSVTSAIERFRGVSGMCYAEPNYLAEATYTPNDPSFGSQWALSKISCPSAWDITLGSSGVTIAIIDTGVDLDHPDLMSKLVAGYDFVNGDTIADDDHGHGTHCAGIAAALTNNGVGVAGVGYNSSVMPIKVLDANGSGSYSDIVSGIYWATDHGAKVISMSLGGSSGSSALQDAVNYAWDHGVLIVAAAGNSNVNTPLYPAYYTNCIAVGSTDSADAKSSFSNFGDWVDVAAPGSSIYSTYPNGYATMSGTSMATPHVAGLAGLVWEHRGVGAAVSTIRSAIETTCDPVGSWVVFGRVNCASALAGGGGPTPIRTDFAPTTDTLLRGTLRRGGLERLLTSDNRRFEVRGDTRGTPRALEMEMSGFVNWTGDLVGLEVSVEAIIAPIGDLPIWLWNFETSAWEQFTSLSLASRERTSSLYIAESPGRYVGPDGEVRVRFYREFDRKVTSLRVDKMTITTVAMAGG